MEPYEQILEGILREVSFGVQTIHVGQASEIPSLQTGYSISSSGQPLTGTGVGDWQKEWIVIGYEECCGDPIFIDSSKKDYPVYTAMHGEGPWDPTQIAVSLEAFGRALSVLAKTAKGRESPVALEANPLSQSEKEATLATFQSNNPGLDLQFWEILLTES